MKKVPCRVEGCRERRVSWCRPDEERGLQYVKVPDDWPDDRPVFCSMTCAIFGGYTSLRPVTEPCKRCLAAGIREQHHGDYQCWRPLGPCVHGGADVDSCPFCAIARWLRAEQAKERTILKEARTGFMMAATAMEEGCPWIWKDPEK